MRTVYLDHNATTRIDPAVVEAMLPFLSESFGNPSSHHAVGEAAAGAVRKARRQVQTLIGAAQDSEIVFTSGGTESDNTALLSALAALAPRNEIIVSAVEHPAVLTLCERLEAEGRARVHRIPVDRCGRIDVAAYEHALCERTAVVSFMWANNETGTLFPVETLAGKAKAAGALFHSDAVQAAGRVPIRVEETAISMMSLSAHKIAGPKGIGALYVRRKTPFYPLILGGRQERNRRGGTENVPAIVGFGEAAERATSRLESEAARMKALRDRLEQGLLGAVPGARVNGDPMARLANTCNIAFEDVDGDGLLALLAREGIACSSGSACSAGSMQPSHVLQAMAIPASHLGGAVRFSLGRDNDDRDIDHVLAVLPSLVMRLRQPAGARKVAWAG
ncbi:cysteine desulfurase [Ciceribacter lividus]|uniref:Cysteine desulfurase n=1 Tax=Ciceribacter lividus TaxID=1197950 RepID=A0A6I7HKX8_9HYPH|nr:cysteine desulfurase NifS [Ciceribacter lividus]RCW24053.1 cysteine desulfurase [Ciceribacter lividus]